MTAEAGTACRHCRELIVPCTEPVRFCKGWKHAAFLRYGPVGAHYCEGRTLSPLAEPEPAGGPPAATGEDERPLSTETATRAEQIVYLTEWASRYGATLQINGQVGFGRPCVGVLKGGHYVDTADVKGREAYQPGGDWWEPEDSYHKHDCLAVLNHDDDTAALRQLYEWVKWLDGHGYGIEEVYRKPSSDSDLAFHGISLPKLVKL